MLVSRVVVCWYLVCSLRQAFDELAECRLVLRNSYAFAYTGLEDSHLKKRSRSFKFSRQREAFRMRQQVRALLSFADRLRV